MSHWTPALDAPAALEADGTESPFVRLPGSVLSAFGVAAAAGLLTANPFLTAASVLALPLFATLLWRPGETPVLLFAVGFQWVQVTAKVFHANVIGVPITQLAFTASVVDAVWLSLTGLVVLAVGMRLGLRLLREATAKRARVEADALSVDRAFLLYVVCYVLAVVVEGAVGIRGSLSQAGAGVQAVHWVAFFIFAYLALEQQKRLLLLAAVVGFEFISGIGFFSGFKTVLFVSLITYFTARPALRPSAVFSGAALVGLLLLVGVAWTVVKPEYREFLNQGSGQQETVVSQDEAMDMLVRLVSDLTVDDLAYGLDPLFRRVAYVDYFSLTLDYVPAVVPHEGGELWAGAVRHVLQPRLLFPNKPVLPSDSDRTAYYTGARIADEGTSISIGYMGESYIDFGRIGMFVPVLLIGLLWGLIYAYFVRNARSALVGYAFATALLVEAYQFEMVGTKLLGGILAKFVVLALLLRFLESRIWSWLGGNEAYEEELGGNYSPAV